MRRLLLSGLLLALLLTTAGVVYAGVSYDGDPSIGEGIWLSWTVKADEPADGWTPKTQYRAKVKNDDDGEIAAEATVWTIRYRGDGKCELKVRLTEGPGGHVLAKKSGRCGDKVKVKWESDDHHHHHDH